MRLSVIGLGYVGAVCSACFSEQGHDVIGMDVDSVKVDLINAGKSPIVEKDLDRLIAQNVKSRRLRATTDLKEAIMNSDITIIAVGTPSKENGDIDLRYIESAAQAVGEILKQKRAYHIVSMRSTVLPGTGHDVVIPMIEKISGKKQGVDFGYVSNPEFLREGTAIYDFYHPPKTVVGYEDDRCGEIFKELYGFLDAPFFEVSIDVAEMIKYADNAWHATKVTFANEIGMICKALGIDSHEVMDVFCADRKLNISTYYLKPGFAFGGSCLPKDVRAITYKAKSVGERTPLLNSLMPSNQYQIDRVYETFIKPSDAEKVAILGISFKPDTDDLRESPILALMRRLLDEGYEVEVFDRNVLKAKEVGANRRLLETELKYLGDVLRDDLDAVVEHSDIVVIGNGSKDFADVIERYPQKTVIDLMRVLPKKSSGNYVGIAW